MHLHFREYGQGPPLVVLHGLFGSLDNWRSISLRLAARFRVLAVDQRNHGRSLRSPEMNYEVMADDLRRFLSEHSIPSAHLLGHSMGGKAAMRFALSFPHMTERLIVADMAPRAYPAVHTGLFNALLSLDLPGFQTRHQIEEALAPAIPNLPVRRFLLKNLARHDAGPFHWKIDIPHLFRNYHRLNEAVDSAHPFAKPALFIRGEKSGYVRDQDRPAIHRLFPHARIHTLPDAGHWLHVEAPDTFLQAVEHFLLDDSQPPAPMLKGES